MMKIIILLILSTPVFAVFDPDTFSNFRNLKESEKLYFLEIFQNEISRKETHSNLVDPPLFSSTQPSFYFISRAYASQSIDNKAILNLVLGGHEYPLDSNPNPCFIAGWIVAKKNGRCPSPNGDIVGPRNTVGQTIIKNTQLEFYGNKTNDIGYPLKNSCENNSKMRLMCNPLIYGFKNDNNEPLCTSVKPTPKIEETCLYQSRNTISKGFTPEDRTKSLLKLIEEYPNKYLSLLNNLGRGCLCSSRLKTAEEWGYKDNGQILDNGEKDYDKVYLNSKIESESYEDVNPALGNIYTSNKSARRSINDFQEMQIDGECISFLNRMIDLGRSLKSCPEKLAIIDTIDSNVSSFTAFFSDLNENNDFQNIIKTNIPTNDPYKESKKNLLASLTNSSEVKNYCKHNFNFDKQERNDCISSYKQWKDIIGEDNFEEFEIKISSKKLDPVDDACRIMDELKADDFLGPERLSHINHNGHVFRNKVSGIDKAFVSKPSNLKKDFSVEKDFSPPQMINNSNKKSGGFWSNVGDFVGNMFGGMNQETVNGLVGLATISSSSNQTQMINPYNYNSFNSTSLSSQPALGSSFTYSGTFGTYK